MLGSAQPDDRLASASSEDTSVEAAGSAGKPSIGGPSVGDRSNGNLALDETELDSALQLLVERAQYITGATGTALALPQGDEMVCRASAGSSAPAVGARLQVRSGLTGESISRRQLLRCDNAEADLRVNLEACRALGIASIVVLPLLRKDGEVRGLFELFSDHPYAFEERDLIALERMAALTVTALDLAEQRQKFAPTVSPRRDRETPLPGSLTAVAPAASSVPPDTASLAPDVPATPIDTGARVPVISATGSLVNPELAAPPISPAELPAVLPSSEPATEVLPVPVPVNSPVVTTQIVTDSESESEPPAVVPEAMRRVQKCAACGFPVSEGRTLCLDCEKKDSAKKELDKKQRDRETEKDKSETNQRITANPAAEPSPDSPPAADSPQEFIPAFLANAEPAKESWLADHVNLLAVIVLILGILVAVVVFR
jgi:putative methionine-R-sulfoxide reductase with GAF domain/uncharacterized Zn finger protein (UPF0148 family)